MPKKKGNTEQREEEVLSPHEDSLTNSKTKKRKKNRKVQDDVEEDVICSAPDEIKKKKKKVQNDVEEDVICSAPDEIKKKKKKIKVQDDVEEDVICSAPDEIKKKKKKVQDDVEEDVICSAPDEIKKKKKKKKVQDDVEEDVICSAPDEIKKKKKKVQDDVEEDVICSAPDEIKKKKKKKKVQDDVEEDVICSAPDEIKKKKKKVQNDVEEDVICSAPDEIKKKKKKIKVQDDVEEDVICSAPDEIKKKKKKIKVRDDVEEVVICSAPDEIKKKKRRRRDEEQTEEVAEHRSDSEIMIIAEEPTLHEEDTEQEENLADSGSALGSSELKELKEFIPDVEQRSADQIRKLLRYDLHRFRRFKQEGVSVRHGRFSEEENRQIKQNVADFLALSGLSSSALLLFPQAFGDEEAHVRRLRAQHNFLERIAEGIPRASQQVCLRARKIFDPHNKMGRFSEEELHSLVKLQNLHGNNWSTISSKMDRSPYSLEKRFSLIASGRGPWTTDEECKLRQAVKSHLEVLVQKGLAGSGLSREQLCKNLPWAKICQKVGTRSWNQCRLKWFSLLQSKLARGRQVFTRGSDGHQAKIKLIETLYKLQVDDMADINWDEVGHVMGCVTPVSIQKMFIRLKLTKVPHWMNLSYGEIIDFLWEKEVPRLRERLKEKQCDQQLLLEDQMYQLSDIISLEDKEFMELDNS